MVPPVPHAKTLQDSHGSQRQGGGLVVGFPISRTSGSQEACQDGSNALVINVVHSNLRPFVVEDALRKVGIISTLIVHFSSLI